MFLFWWRETFRSLLNTNLSFCVINLSGCSIEHIDKIPEGKTSQKSFTVETMEDCVTNVLVRLAPQYGCLICIG